MNSTEMTYEQLFERLEAEARASAFARVLTTQEMDYLASLPLFKFDGTIEG